MSRYVTVEEIGRGGMGRVTRAYDPKLQREVALKEIRHDALHSGAVERLVAEARAMAKLSHPNVVQVYDVDVLEDGNVVLVLEYVRGQTLKQWQAEARPRAWTEILQRYLAAGRGLVASHEAGILHRDFKPTNVLVDQATVKVADFGLAKAVTLPDTEGSSQAVDSSDGMTCPGMIMGTPRYMAPEQHQGNVLGAAADQYAYCLALWEALSGAFPFSAKSLVRQKIEGPPRWSGPRIPPRIVRALTRGLAPNPGDRWPSMRALLDALERSAAGRRNRWLLGLVGLGAVGLGFASYEASGRDAPDPCRDAARHLVGIWDAPRREAVETAMLGIERPYASAAWEQTRSALDGYGDDWKAMHTQACEATNLRAEQSPAVLDLRMTCLRRALFDLRATVEVLRGADEGVVLRAYELTGGLPPLARCADVEALAAEVEPPLPSEAAAVNAAHAELARARSLIRAGHYAAAKEAIVAAKDAVDGVEYGPIQTDLARWEASVLEELGDFEASSRELQRALRLSARWHQAEAMGWIATLAMYVVGARQGRIGAGLQYGRLARGLVEGRPEAEAWWRSNRAILLRAQGNYAEAEAEHRRALALNETRLGRDHPSIAKSRNNLANVLQEQGRFAEAEAEHRAALAIRASVLGPEHPDVATSHHNLASALYGQGRFVDAEEEFRIALKLRTAALGPKHPDVAASRDNLGVALARQGDFDEAEIELRAAIDLKAAALGPEHVDLAASRDNLGLVLGSMGRYPQAEAEHRAALASRLAALGPTHPLVAASRNNLAGDLAMQGKHAEAEAEYRAVIALRQDVLGPRHPRVAVSRHSLAEVLLAQGRLEAAEPEARAALELREAILDPNHPDLAASRYVLAALLVELDRPAEALALAEEAWSRRRQDDIPAAQRADTAFLLARLLWEASPADRDRAQKLAQVALDSYPGGAFHAPKVRRVRQWLDAHPRRTGHTVARGPAGN
jgi:serine/threonine-protein kinase